MQKILHEHCAWMSKLNTFFVQDMVGLQRSLSHKMMTKSVKNMYWTVYFLNGIFSQLSSFYIVFSVRIHIVIDFRNRCIEKVHLKSDELENIDALVKLGFSISGNYFDSYTQNAPWIFNCVNSYYLIWPYEPRSNHMPVIYDWFFKVFQGERSLSSVLTTQIDGNSSHYLFCILLVGYYFLFYHLSTDF